MHMILYNPTVTELLGLDHVTCILSFVSGNVNLAQGSRIVLSLAEPPLNQGYMIWLERFYNSPELYLLLQVSFAGCYK